jgi:hypothetical protein
MRYVAKNVENKETRGILPDVRKIEEKWEV